MTTIHLVRHEAAPAQLSVERARDLIAEARGLDEVKKVRDVAIAMKAYAREQKAGLAIKVDACEIIMRADRRLGELARGLPKATKSEAASARRDRTGPSVGPVTKQAALADLGATKQRANEWEKAASLPDQDVDVYVGACRKSGQAPATGDLVKLAKLDAPVRKQVLARLGDVASVRKAIADVRKVSAPEPPAAAVVPLKPEERWHASDEVDRVEEVVREVVRRWQGKNLRPLVDALESARERVEREHARRNAQ